MALRKPADAGAVAAAVKEPVPAGKFEEDTVVSNDAAAQASVSASTAIAKAGATAVAVTGKNAVFGNLENAMPSLDFGVLPRLVGSNGQVMDGDKKMLGTFVEGQLISWNNTFVVSPGDDTPEAKEAVRYSKDGQTIDGTGESVAAYLKKLREVDGYDEAAVKQYCELVVLLSKSEKPSDHVGNMVVISLSPQSRKLFEGYRYQESVKVALKKRSAEGIEQIKVSTEVKSQGQNTFTLLKTGAAA